MKNCKFRNVPEKPQIAVESSHNKGNLRIRKNHKEEKRTIKATAYGDQDSWFRKTEFCKIRVTEVGHPSLWTLKLVFFDWEKFEKKVSRFETGKKWQKDFPSCHKDLNQVCADWENISGFPEPRFLVPISSVA